VLTRSKGSHRIDIHDSTRVAVPFHAGGFHGLSIRLSSCLAPTRHPNDWYQDIEGGDVWVACILSITGKSWDVERFAARSGAVPDESFKRGQMSEGPEAYRIKVSGMRWVLGPHAFVSMKRQVAAAVRFLEDAGVSAASVPNRVCAVA
jgi:hypothetical protein